MSETHVETNEEKLNEAEVNPESENAEDNVESLEAKVEEKAEESEQTEEESFKDKFYYLAAEMDNMKKRTERDRQNLIKFGNEKVLKGLIEVVDNLDRTIDAVAGDEDEKVKNIVTGIEMVRTQFVDVLKNNGLEEIETVGKVFDPNFHEAMAQQPAEGKEDEEIIQEFQKGYVLNGRLLRASKVVITKNK